MKKYRVAQTSLTNPHAWIVTNNRTSNISNDRGRKKIYGNKIYLDDGQEFELELFNPTSNSVLAAININGEKISNSGLVLRPGERVYLDCFLESRRKFTFKTYQTEATEESARAIQNNGVVDIYFYPQKTYTGYSGYFGNSGTTTTIAPGLFGQTQTIQWPYSQINSTGSSQTYTTINNTNSINNITQIDPSDYSFSGTQTGSFYSQPTSLTVGNLHIDLSGQTATNAQNLLSTTLNSYKKQILNDKIETGRVESGSSSNQTFESVSMDFESHYTSSIRYLLLPEKIRPVTIEDFKPKNYCSKCGRKLSGDDNFCPSCGQKLK